MSNRDDLELQRKAVNQLGIILRTAQIHSINNVAVTSAIEKFVYFVNEILFTENNVALELRGEYFYFNDNRMRYAPEHLLNFDYLVREFRRVELGAIIIRREMTAMDMLTFTRVFISSSFLQAPFDEMKERMATSNIEIKRLENIIEEYPDVKKMVKKTYFKAVSYTKGVLKKISKGEKVNLKSAKRVITSLVNQILEQEQLLLGMTAIKDYDEYTYHHSTNVSILSVALGQRLGLSRKMLVELGIVSLFHDIGKTEIPNEVLNKPGALTDDEWKTIKRHPKYGVKVLLSMRNLDDLTIKTAIGAFEHHMNCDLTGYPRPGLETELDFFSRIVSIADQYDAMTAERVYRRAPMSPEKAIAIMTEKAGKELDALLFKFFVNMVGVFPAGTLVMLDSRELGFVYENNHLFLQRPRVMIIADRDGNQVKGDVVDLTEKNDNDEYARTIIKTLDASEYNLKLADYLLLQD
ncbi:MAG: HD-GYP domain-containing protein [Nitrospiraceae bacterium]|nr:MAG: HD-GYP domain-containing protein [Nitrospiraceae bacterium]